jgi:tetratricopeptide (TPR) repeat protein
VGGTSLTPETIDLLELAKDMVSAGQYDGAVTAYEEALRDLERDVTSPLAASTHNDMAVAMFQLGDLDGAAEHMLKAVFLNGHFQQWTDFYLSLLSLAQIHRARGEHRMAITCRIHAGKVRAHLARIQPMNRVEESRMRSFQQVVDTTMMRTARSR